MEDPPPTAGYRSPEHLGKHILNNSEIERGTVRIPLNGFAPRLLERFLRKKYGRGSMDIKGQECIYTPEKPGIYDLFSHRYAPPFHGNPWE
jgi:hypothetical protein